MMIQVKSGEDNCPPVSLYILAAKKMEAAYSGKVFDKVRQGVRKHGLSSSDNQG